MKKKIISIVLIFLSVICALSAESRFKVGLEEGNNLNVYVISENYTKDNPSKEYAARISSYGKGFALTGEYDFSEKWGVKAKFGIAPAGTLYVNKFIFRPNEYAGIPHSRIGFYFLADAKYMVPLTDEMTLSPLFGLEAVFGTIHECYDSYHQREIKDKNFALGLNAGVETELKATDRITVNCGFTCAWFFINTLDFYKNKVESSGNLKIRYRYSYSLRGYLGATYSF